jgi:hypothetical protein
MLVWGRRSHPHSWIGSKRLAVYVCRTDFRSCDIVLTVIPQAPQFALPSPSITSRMPFTWSGVPQAQHPGDASSLPLDNLPPWMVDSD